jgi:A/G-specific adenine glycosylase
LKGVQKLLLDWYARHGRKHLPWRVVRDPYYTLVSEFMLQQTQVDRVVPKFEAFVSRFPDVRALAAASAGDVLRLWQGLGYNSRAVRLHALARCVVERFGGAIPRDADRLRTLPGVGPYTVAAIRAFAYEEDDAPIDTNIRRIVHRLFFGIEYPARATPRELDTRAREIVPAGNAHDWNSALMDLGATLCTARAPKCLLCPLQTLCGAAPVDAASLEALRSRTVRKRSTQNTIPFEQTTRYARGRIVDRLRELAPGKRISFLELYDDVAPLLPQRTANDVRVLVERLERDGLIARSGEEFSLIE